MPDFLSIYKMNGSMCRGYVQTQPHFFQPLEVSILKYFCPALIGVGPHEIDIVYQELLSQSTKKGGMAIRNPQDLTAHILTNSMAATKHLALSLVDNERDFDHNSH